jgi:hypothetical protein
MKSALVENYSASAHQGLASMNIDPATSDGIEPYPDEDRAFVVLYDSIAFADFEQAMDEMLEALVGRWVHLAAPRAAADRVRRTTMVIPKKKAK